MNRRVWGVAFAALGCAGCPDGKKPAPLHAVTELPSPGPMASDPAVRGDWSYVPTLPPGAATDGDNDEGAPAVNALTKWQSSRFSLGASETKSIDVPLAGPSIVVAQVIATGSADPVDVSITSRGVVTSTAAPVALPPDRFFATTSASVDAAQVAIRLVRHGGKSVDVKLLVGVLPKSAVGGAR